MTAIKGGNFRTFDNRNNDYPDTFRNGNPSFSGNAGNFFDQNTRSDSATRTNLNNSSQTTKKGPKFPQYSITCIRLSTFQTWPSGIQQSPETMADAGFYYTGNTDHVRCFYCGIGLQNWDSEDNPYVEHARWSAECLYLKEKKGQDFINTVQDAVRRVQMEEALQGSQTDGFAETFESDHEEDGTPRANPKDFLPNGKPPSKAEKKNPLLTDAAQSIFAMGYLPKYIKVVVNKVLQEKGWVALKSTTLMEEIYNMEESGEISRSQMTLPTISKVKEMVKSTRQNLKALPEDLSEKIKNENKEMKEQRQCKICCEEAVSIVFLPCGHLTSCSQCAPALKSCPVCRTEIKGSVKVAFK